MINAKSSQNSKSFLNMPMKMADIRITEANEDEEESKEVSKEYSGSFCLLTQNFDESNALGISF